MRSLLAGLSPLHSENVDYVDGIRTSHGIALTITKLIDSYSQGIFTFCLPPLSIEMN